MKSSHFSGSQEPPGLSGSKTGAPPETIACSSWRSFWVGLLAAAVVCGGMYFYRLGYWPWDVDELSSLEEMGLLDPEIRTTVYHPESIVVRLPRLVPVWYSVQRMLLQWLPVDEWGSRFSSALCAVLAVTALYGWGWRWRGTSFAAALALLAGGSLLMVWLAQQNRFYTMAFFWLVLAEASVWAKSKHWGWLLGAAVFTLLAILTHNVAIVLFGFQAAVVIVGWLVGGASAACALRAGVCGALAAGVYLVHVRPIAGDWTGVGFTWAPPWASFTAHVGMPTLVLALLGTAAALAAEKDRRQMAVWAALTLAVLVFVFLSPQLMPVWNPRYSLLWVLPLWVTGALAVETGAAALLQWANPPSGQASRGLAGKKSQLLSILLLVSWYGCAALLLAPKWASHWIDGTRHDYRQAAHWVVQWLQENSFLFGPLQASAEHSPLPSVGEAGQASAWPGEGNKKTLLVSLSAPQPGPKPAGPEHIRPDAPGTIPILTNMELQMRYYLPQPVRSHCRYWTPGMPLPPGQCLVVLGGNGWEAPLALPGRTVQWIGLVGRRRFDELSHVVRIYWVGPGAPPQQSP